jgi:hypothetical protein
MTDRYLKTPDFWCELALAHSVKRALIRHFDAFLHQQIQERGFSSRDPKLFNQETVAHEVWGLADKVIVEVKDSFTDVWEVVVGGEFGDIREWVASALQEQISEVQDEFLADELMGLNGLIEMASGTRIEIGGTGKEIDFGMGPGDDD